MDGLTETKKRVVTACRILERAGVFDEFGYFSARWKSSKALINRAIPAARMTVQDLLLIDLNGKSMTEDKVDRDAALHWAIYRKRPDVTAIVHTHSPMVVTLSIAGIRLKAVENMGSILFPSDIPLYDKYGPVAEIDQANDVAEALGSGNLLVLRGHGSIVAGTGIEETCMTALYVERCAAFQYRTVLIGGAFPFPEKEREKSRNPSSEADTLKRSWDYFERVVHSGRDVQRKNGLLPRNDRRDQTERRKGR